MYMNKIKVSIPGGNGRMGKTLIRLILENKQLTMGNASCLAGEEENGMDLGLLAGKNKIDKYLTDITERQDFSLNMTSIKEENLKSHTLNWLNKLNEKFGNLDKNKLLKTGGYDKHSKHQEKKKQIDRNLTTKDSLNYGAQEGTMR